MNLIDILAIVAIGFGIWRGFRNGVIIEVASLLGLIVGIWAGMRLAFIFANYYRDTFEIPSNYIPLLAFFSAFLIGLGVVWLAAKLATRFLKTVQLNLPNRIAGAAFGALKWAFLLGTLLSMIGNSEVITDETKQNSTAYPLLNGYCRTVTEYTVGLLPAVRNVFDEMETYFTDLDSTRRANEPANPPADSTAAQP